MERKRLITGASSGIGKEIYTFFKTISDASSAPHPPAVIGVSRSGPDFKSDLSKKEDLNTLVALIPKHSLEILVNNAGILSFEENNYDVAKKIVDLNLMAVWYLTTKLYEEDKFTDDAVIINIASISGLCGEADVPLYAATKAAIISLTKSFAKKFIDKGIRVNSISPGLFDTNLVPGEVPQEILDMIPMKRSAETSEILPAVACILNSKYMTGSNIVIDGGRLLR